jgi:hypothetical protein
MHQTTNIKKSSYCYNTGICKRYVAYN